MNRRTALATGLAGISAQAMAAPALARVNLWARDFDSRKWVLTPYDEVIMSTPVGRVRIYCNQEDQLVLTHWDNRYIQPHREGLPGNMLCCKFVNWEEFRGG